MAASKVIVYLLTVLIPLAVVNCQYLSGLPSTHGTPSFPGRPSIPGIPNIPGMGNIRGRRHVPSSHSDVEDSIHQESFFSSHFGILFGTKTSCNYTTEPGRTCRSCTQVLTCRSNNKGNLSTCQGFFPNCNSGVCSRIQMAACGATTTASSTTTTIAAPGK